MSLFLESEAKMRSKYIKRRVGWVVFLLAMSIMAYVVWSAIFAYSPAHPGITADFNWDKFEHFHPWLATMIGAADLAIIGAMLAEWGPF